MKTSLRRFMAGRHGNDELSLMMLLTGGVCLLFAAISRNRTASLCFVVILIILVFWSVFRMLSRNTAARERENRMYKELTGGFGRKTLGFRESMAAWWKNLRGERLPRRGGRSGVKLCLFKCPGCGVDVKVPGNRGKVSVTCPRCGKTFERIS